jgi:hypothetical protein
MRFLLLVSLLGAVFVLAQDAPHPDAAPFCQHMDDSKTTYCPCPTANDGTLCSTEDPLPTFCQKMCGHARDCHCCGLNK